jgi:hypothetical protein
MASPYEYQTLGNGEIRVLTVLPGKFAEAIVVRLDHFVLNNVKYRADAYLLRSQREDPNPSGDDMMPHWSDISHLCFDDRSVGYDAISYA